MTRVIGVHHRCKKTTEGEDRPTELAIIEGGLVRKVLLESEDEELSMVKEECRPGDIYAMILGGSGDALAVAFARKGATVLRVPPFVFKKERGEGADKDNDAELLAKLAMSKREIFYEMRLRDLPVVRVSALWQLCEEAMDVRIACGNRLHQRLFDRLLMEEGEWPEGKIEDLAKKELANDKIYKALKADEARYVSELTKELERLDVYTQLLKPLEGVGPKIAARLIAAVQDIRRFPNEHAFKAYCGLAVGKEGQFTRRRRGEVANYSPVAREAFYLLGDQFNRRPDSDWGIKLLENKRRQREKHPVPEKVVGKNGRKVTKYSDGHILKRAKWRTVTQFAVWFYREWRKLEGGHQVQEVQEPAKAA